MAFVYTQNNKYDSPFDPKRCKASVAGERVTIWQCQRKPWRDGWCKQHHPDTEKARDEASRAKYDARWKRREEAEVESAVALLEELGYTVLQPKEANAAE